jgi:ribosomal protein S18 acetylase RimI-like enzyme
MAGHSVEIRLMRPADVPAAAAIAVAAWRATYRGLIADGLIDAQTEDAHAAALGALLPSEPPAVLLVGEDGGAVAGFAVAAASRDDEAPPGEGELWGIYVDPGRQGSGIGSALMRAALDHLRAHGFSEAILWMLEGNRLADAFYRARGWVPDGARRIERTPSGHPLPEIRYRIRLG